MKKSKKLIISLNGQEGSGKSTAAKMIAEKLKIPHYYMGQMFRDMANEKGLTLPEFRKICDADPNFDKEVDDRVIRLSEELTEFVIESRTAWHFIPDSIKIYLKVDSLVAAQRIFKALSEKNNRGNEDVNLNSIENIQKSILQRRKEDSERYFSLYGIRQDDEENYDLVIDTTKLVPGEVFAEIMNFIKLKNNG